MSCAPHGASLPSDILKFVPFWELKIVSAGRVVGRVPRAAHWGPGPLAVLSSFRPLGTFAIEKCHMDAPEGRAPLRQLPAPFVTWKELPVPWTHTHSFTGDLGLPSCLSHLALCPEQGHTDPEGPTCSTRSASADGLPSDRVLIVSASSPGRPLGEFLVVVPGAGAQPIGGGGHGVNGGSRGGGWGMGSRLEAHCPHPQVSPVALAKSVLAEVPRQLVEYHSHKECL